jgi:parvulin-like peptidyl-prolyl isomerase
MNRAHIAAAASLLVFVMAACDATSLSSLTSARSQPPQATIVNGTPVARASVETAALGVTINAPAATEEPPTPTPAPTETPTPALAAIVNDQPVTLEQFNVEMARYMGDVDPASEAGQQKASTLKLMVLDDLILRVLIEQEAARQGVTVPDAQIEEEIGVARQRSGGDEAYAAWLAASKLTEDEARALTRQELLTAALRDKLLADMPREAEYVRAFHILVNTESEARQVLARLDAGAKVGPLARAVSVDDSTRADDGDLGWFARSTGVILWPEVEEAAFALQPGETSGIVKSPVGFHIIRVTAREMRPLTDADLAALQQKMIEDWLANLRLQARIEIIN